MFGGAVQITLGLIALECFGGRLHQAVSVIESAFCDAAHSGVLRVRREAA